MNKLLVLPILISSTAYAAPAVKIPALKNCVNLATGKVIPRQRCIKGEVEFNILNFVSTTQIQNVQGQQGATGAQGEKGNTGAQGSKGDKGEAGAQGAQGIQGTQGEQGIKGDKGDKGEQGTPGIVNIPGCVLRVGSATNTSVNTVTTVCLENEFLLDHGVQNSSLEVDVVSIKLLGFAGTTGAAQGVAYTVGFNGSNPNINFTTEVDAVCCPR